MTVRTPGQDKVIPMIIAPSKFCPRKLTNDGVSPSVKRYMSKGPLLGYMISCPGCGFVEMHMNEKVGYVESSDGVLRTTMKPVTCLVCQRTIKVSTDPTTLVTSIEAKAAE